MEDGRFKLDDFQLYRAAREFRKRVYGIVPQLPASERYCLNPQMRRAALSVSNNIAEGHGRWHYQENLHFCRIVRGSIDEVLDDLSVFEDENYGNLEAVKELRAEAYELIKKI